jgi:hypothetical protein
VKQIEILKHNLKQIQDQKSSLQNQLLPNRLSLKQVCSFIPDT